jgi:hypothetical protein
VDLEAAPDRIDGCVAAVMAELPKLEGSDYFSDGELAGAANRIEIGRALERETTTGRAHALTAAWTSASLDYDTSLEGAARSVTRPALAAALDHWVLGKPFVMGAMASLKQIDSGLTEDRLDRLVGIAPRFASGKAGGRP